MTLVDQPVDQPIRTTGNNLVGLWRPAFIKVHHRLFVFGGGGNTSSELHTLDLCDMQWRTIHVIYMQTSNKQRSNNDPILLAHL